MGNWCCFKFWFCWRLLMASLAHFNWITAIYMNCIYFTMWKSYDILWFWMHLILCICLKPLRCENYLLVWFNLFTQKRNRHRNKTYQQIYNLLYNQQFTKSERALKRIETIERGGHKWKNMVEKDNDEEAQDNEVDEMSSDSEDEEIEATGTSGMYPTLSRSKEEPTMPRIIVDREAKKGPSILKQRTEGEALLAPANLATVAPPSTTPSQRNETPTVSSGSKSGISNAASRLLQKAPKKLVPNFLMSSNGSRENSPPKTEAEAKLIDQQKQRLKEEKREQKALQKRINAERKEELRILATAERRRRNIASAIDLLLTWLRLMTTFAIMVGNMHKTFMPKYWASPDQDMYEHPDLLMIFTITMSIDIMLFWFMMFWTYWQQCRLCCRLGVCKFWMWLITLGFFGGICMYMPMHYINEQLDPTWCAFMPGSDLSQYMDG